MAYRLEDLARDMRRALALSPAEAARRLSGRAARYARRVRNRRSALGPSDGEFLSALKIPASTLSDYVARRQETPPLAPASSGCAAIAARLQEGAAPTLEPMIQAARRAAEGTFDLLGSGPVALGPLPDWQRDFKSGKRWDPTAYSLEIQVRPDRGEDIKVPWELSRLQHLPLLGMASAATGDPAFREAGAAQLAGFLAGNPPYHGVNWRCTMDVALRASEILAAEGYLRGAGGTDFWGKVLKSLLLHGRFILDNLELGPVLGNHYLADLAGLYLCGVGLREFREAERWRELARDGLLSEMRRQVGRDGLDYEASLSYHALVTEMFLFPALLSGGGEEGFPDDFLGSLERMVEAVATLIRPDGSLPQIGDNDDGRFLIFSQYHRPRRDWRPLLALGSYLFRRGDWLALSGDAWVEGAWVLGEAFLRWRESAQGPAGPREFRCAAFPDAGIYQLAAGPVQMVVDAGPVGQGGHGGHAHNDTLAFDLYGHGREALPDRGTGTYTADLRLRNQLRSTSAHNALQVDGAEINPIPGEPFRLPGRDAPRALRWRERERYAFLVAEHSGYAGLPEGVIHRRSFLMDRAKRSFLIEERLEGRGRHRFVASFHLAPGWRVLPLREGWAARDGEGRGLLEFSWIRPPRAPRLRVEEAVHSSSYGVACPAPALRIEWEGEVPCRIRYRLRLAEGEGK